MRECKKNIVQSKLSSIKPHLMFHQLVEKHNASKYLNTWILDRVSLAANSNDVCMDEVLYNL